MPANAYRCFHLFQVQNYTFAGIQMKILFSQAIIRLLRIRMNDTINLFSQVTFLILHAFAGIGDPDKILFSQASFCVLHAFVEIQIKF